MTSPSSSCFGIQWLGWYSARLLLWLHFMRHPTHQHTQILYVPAMLIFFCFLEYTVLPPTLSHLPVIFSFPHPNFPYELPLTRQVSSHFLPSPPTCRCSLMAPSTFAPEHIPCRWVDLSDYLSHVCLLHETVSFRTVTVSLTNKKYSMCFKIEVIFQNLIIENYETSVSVYFQCFPTFLLYKYFQTSLKS